MIHHHTHIDPAAIERLFRALWDSSIRELYEPIVVTDKLGGGCAFMDRDYRYARDYVLEVSRRLHATQAKRKEFEPVIAYREKAYQRIERYRIGVDKAKDAITFAEANSRWHRAIRDANKGLRAMRLEFEKGSTGK